MFGKVLNSFKNLGASLVEILVVLFIVGSLVTLGLGFNGPGYELATVQADLAAVISEAKHLARARGSNVTVALGSASQFSDVPPLILPSKVKWGKPSHVPMPPGMADTIVAATTGESHPKITITPRYTSTAAAWFLNDGRDVLCMRLSGQGRCQILRWHSDKGTWKRE